MNTRCLVSLRGINEVLTHTAMVPLEASCYIDVTSAKDASKLQARAQPRSMYGKSGAFLVAMRKKEVVSHEQKCCEPTNFDCICGQEWQFWRDGRSSCLSGDLREARVTALAALLLSPWREGEILETSIRAALVTALAKPKRPPGGADV